MIFQAKPIGELSPLDDMRGVVPGGERVVVAVPELPEALAHLAAAFELEVIGVVDTASGVELHF